MYKFNYNTCIGFKFQFKSEWGMTMQIQLQDVVINLKTNFNVNVVLIP